MPATCWSCTNVTGRTPSRSIRRRGRYSSPGRLRPPIPAGTQPVVGATNIQKIVGAANLAECIRRYGHLAAQHRSARLRRRRRSFAVPEAHGITDDDLKQLPASLVGGPVAESSANAFEAIEKLRRVYCSTTGFDFAHVFVPEEREWLRDAAESGRFLPPMDAARAPRRCSIG